MSHLSILISACLSFTGVLYTVASSPLHSMREGLKAGGDIGGPMGTDEYDRRHPLCCACHGVSTPTALGLVASLAVCGLLLAVEFPIPPPFSLFFFLVWSNCLLLFCNHQVIFSIISHSLHFAFHNESHLATIILSFTVNTSAPLDATQSL